MYFKIILFSSTFIYAFLSPTDCEQVAEGIIRVPLVHMKSGLETMLERGASPELIGGIYAMYQNKAQPWRLQTQEGKPVPANDTVALWKYFETQFYAKIDIGKPGRTFKMIMNTDWGYSWVMSSMCSKAELPCAVHEKYDHSQSKTYKPDGRPFNISNHIGILSSDTFHVGQLNCTDQMFGELTSVPWIWTLYGPDGILGLGFPGLSPNIKPFPLNFFIQNKFQAPVFSFYINRDPTTPRGGSLFFGGIDPKHNKTAFTTVNVTSTFYWMFKLDKIQVVLSKKQKVTLCPEGCEAMADTSTNSIVGPAEDIRAINKYIGADRVFFWNRYLIPCVNEFKGPKLSFFLGGKEFQIKGQDYVQKISYSGITVCLSAFLAGDASYPKNTWSLGGAFLYRYYTAYDYYNRQFSIADVA